MATKYLAMPSNFTKFPECPHCQCKNFTRETGKLTGKQYYVCDSCDMAWESAELGIDTSTATPDPVLHPHIKQWNSPSKRNEVAEVVHNMEKEGSKPLRVRKPWEL